MTQGPRSFGALLAILATAGTAGAAHTWRLDASFRGTGQAMIAAHEIAPYAGVFVGKKGRIVVCGHLQSPTQGSSLGLSGFLKDGQTDPAFGTGGAVVEGFSGEGCALRGAAQQPDGKIVLAGSLGTGGASQAALYRVLPNGAFDEQFGTSGMVCGPTGYNAPFAGTAVQADGKVLGVGQGLTNAGVQAALVRFQSDGALDPTFGSGGIVLTTFGSGGKSLQVVAVQPDGKILAGGTDSSGAIVVRLNADGALDTTFGSQGVAALSKPGMGATVRALAVLKSGRIVAAGDTDTAQPTAYLAALTRDGTPAPGFGSSGYALGPPPMLGRFLLVQRDGKLILGGDQGGTDTATLVRFSARGARDRSFGSAGLLSVVAPGGRVTLTGGAVQPDGRVLVSGYESLGQTDGIFVQRYLR